MGSKELGDFSTHMFHIDINYPYLASGQDMSPIKKSFFFSNAHIHY